MSDPVIIPLTRCCGKMVARGQPRNVFVPCNLPCPEPDEGAEPRCSKHDAEAFARRADEASRKQRAVNQIVRRLPDILAAIPARCEPAYPALVCKNCGKYDARSQRGNVPAGDQVSAPPEGFRPVCTRCRGERFTPSGVCLDCPAKGCGKCGREACKADLQVKVWGIADEAALLDCERAKSARLAGELTEHAAALAAMHRNADEWAAACHAATLRADKAERALAAVAWKAPERAAMVESYPDDADDLKQRLADAEVELMAVSGELSRHRIERVAIVDVLGGGITDANLVERVLCVVQDRDEYKAEMDAAATAPAEVARVTLAEARGVIVDIGNEHVAVNIGAQWIPFPEWPGATIGDAVTVTVRKG